MLLVRTIPFVALALSIIVLPLSRAQAQPGILRAAAQHMRDRATVPISVDPRLYAGRGLPSADTPLHADTLLAELTGDSTITVVTRERALECSVPAKPECRTNGVAYFVLFSVPVARGDSAFVDVFIRASKAPTAADSASVMASLATRPEMLPSALNRLNTGAATAASMILIRTAAVWRVAAFQVRGQS